MYTSIVIIFFFCFFFLKILVAIYRCRGYPLGPSVQVCKCSSRDKCNKSHNVRTELRYDTDVISRLAVFARGGHEGEDGGKQKTERKHKKRRKVVPLSEWKHSPCRCPATCTLLFHFPLLYSKKKIKTTRKNVKRKRVLRRLKRLKRCRQGTEVLLEVVTACGAVNTVVGGWGGQWLAEGWSSTSSIQEHHTTDRMTRGFIHSAKNKQQRTS